jgi:RNA polymerase sigma factor (sigma-70 family)
MKREPLGNMAERFGYPSRRSLSGRADCPFARRSPRGRFEELRAMTERQLLHRFVTANDPDAFRVLIERHGPMVLAVCRSILRQRHDAEDAFQNTFLELARHAGTIRNGETIGPWLHRVAVRTAHKARHRTSLTRTRESMSASILPTTCIGPPDLSFVPVLREEVSRLPDRYRLPVTLCYLDGKTNEEAAARLSCPVGTIKGRLTRARRALRARLSRRGLGSDFAPKR